LRNNFRMSFDIKEIYETKVVGWRGEFIGVMSPYSNAAQVLPAIWAEFFRRENEIGAAADARLFGVMSMEGDATIYLAGVETEADAIEPFGLASATIPMGRYLAVTHYGDAATIAATTERAYKEVFPASGKVMRLAPHLEVYDDRFNPDSPDSAMEIWIPIEAD
jgi:predicted transcriptional regulator YdeE